MLSIDIQGDEFSKAYKFGLGLGRPDPDLQSKTKTKTKTADTKTSLDWHPVVSWPRSRGQQHGFLPRDAAVLARLGVVILSICLSVWHTRALRQNQAMHCGYFDTTRASFRVPTVVGGRLVGDAPFCLRFALKVIHPLRKERVAQKRF